MIPKVTIVVPIYNVQDYLKQCLSSLSAQTLGDIEILLINDGSTDASRDICIAACQADPRMQLIDKKNGGCASARNRGLSLAKGEYVAFVDSDDWVTVNMFELLYSEAMRTGADIVQCGFEKYYQSAHIFQQHHEDWICSDLGPDGSRVTVSPNIMNTQPSIWRRLYKRSFLSKHGIVFPSFPRFDDLPFQFMSFAFANKIVALAEPCYFYRLGRSGQDVAINDERLFVHFEIFDLLCKFCDKVDERWLEEALYRQMLMSHKWALKRLGKGRLSRQYRKHVRLAAAEYIKRFGLPEELLLGMIKI